MPAPRGEGASGRVVCGCVSRVEEKSEKTGVGVPDAVAGRVSRMLEGLMSLCVQWELCSQARLERRESASGGKTAARR